MHSDCFACPKIQLAWRKEMPFALLTTNLSPFVNAKGRAKDEICSDYPVLTYIINSFCPSLPTEAALLDTHLSITLSLTTLIGETWRHSSPRKRQKRLSLEHGHLPQKWPGQWRLAFPDLIQSSRRPLMISICLSP